MRHVNLNKARAKVLKAENEALRDEIISGVEVSTTQYYMDKLKADTGWTISHFAKYTGYSHNAVKGWYLNNKNTIVVKEVCAGIMRRYWHQRNKERYVFDFESDKW